MNKKDYTLTHFITKPFFLGLTYSYVTQHAKTDAIFACLLGMFIGILIIILFNKTSITKKGSKIIQIILYLFFILTSIMLLEIIITSFYLINTPKLISIIPTILLCFYASTKKMDTIKNSSFILYIFAIIISMLTLISLTKNFQFSNLMPFFVAKKTSFLKAAFTFAILSSAPNILVINENIPLKKHVIYYVINTLYTTIFCLFIIGCLSIYVTNIYSFPEFMILKRIKMLEFIENVENIVTMVWYIDNFFNITLSIKRTEELINNKLISWSLVIVTTLFTTFVINSHYNHIMFIYHYAALITGILIVILLLSTLKKLNPTRNI